MPDRAYRDDMDALRAKADALESELAGRDAELGVLRARVAEQEEILGRLARLAAPGPTAKARRGRWLAVIAVASIATACVADLSRYHDLWGAALRRTPAAVQVTPDPGVLSCSKLGVLMTVDGEDVEVAALGDGDLAGHHYRRDKSRSPWFTVNGDRVYVHGVGDYLPGDLGSTHLSLLTIMVKGDDGGYTLARGGRSLLVVERSDGGRIAGRFEADVSKVAEVTREPPFGTPVVRVRGTFCLQALPADPNDTGP
jgi:hypothetical protein